MGKLYQLEKSLKETNVRASTIFAVRIEKAKPVVFEIKERLEQASLKVLPKSPLGTAVFYALTHWEALKSYLYDGRLESIIISQNEPLSLLLLDAKTGYFMATTWELGPAPHSIL